MLLRIGKWTRQSPWMIVVALMALTLLLRAWELEHTPPWIWFDEAGNGLDARELLNGRFSLFFSRSLGKEPLYNYLATPFVAAWDSTALAVRLPGALLGTLMIPALYAAGRALWRENRDSGVWAGLTAAGIWAINYWPQSINRISFRANTLPLLITVAIVAWLSWTRRPSRRRAATFGALAGLTLYTYLAARATVLLWPLLFLALPAGSRRALWRTLPWAVLACAWTVAPLAVYFALNPEDALLRTGTVTALVDPGGISGLAATLANNLLKVLGGFLGWTGDPLPRHNLPGRPPFALPLAAAFALGVMALSGTLLRRSQRGWTLLLWWGVMILPAVLAAEGNPHSLRLFGALPAALLISVAPLAWIVSRLPNMGVFRPQVRRRVGAVVLLALLLAFGVGEGARTVHAYFLDWRRNSDLYHWYQGDISTYGAQVRATPGTLGLVSRSTYFYILDYAFKPARFLQTSVAEDEIEADLVRATQDLRGARLAVPVWRDGLMIDTDPKEVLPFYLAREGTLLARVPFRGFDLLSFQLGADPQFDAQGRQMALATTFDGGLSLLQSRWGVAFPNENRGGDMATAGTAVWAEMTWQGPGTTTGAYPLTVDLKVAVDILDQQGHRLASDERLLLNAQHLPTSGWIPGVLARSYHLVTIPPTQLPGSVRLQARVYQADTLAPVWVQGEGAPLAVSIDSVEVTENAGPIAAESLPIARRADLHAAPGVALLGLAPWKESVAPGETLTLRLFWEVTAASDAQTLTLTLGQGDVRAMTHLPAGLREGSIVHTDVDLRLPADMASGIHELRLADVPVGEVVVVGRARQFEAPDLWLSARASFGGVVGLLGIDVPETMRVEPSGLRVAPGQEVRFTLAWQAYRTPDQDLKRFVHLVGMDGQPIAQEDLLPCLAACQAPSWLANEILLDEATIRVPLGLAPGRYRLVVGWYDPESRIRLPARDKTGASLADDVAPLPLVVDVVP